MKKCKYCNMPIKVWDSFCPSCGYDFKTDTISPSFKQNAVPGKEEKRSMRMEERRRGYGVRPGVKIFAFIGLAVVVFTILHKHNFDLDGVMSEVKQTWDKVKIEAGKFFPREVEKKKEPEKKTEESETFSPSKPLIVQGVIWGGVKPQAIINNRITNIGDIIEGATVIDINKQGVTLLYKDRSYLLPSSVSKYKND